MFCRVHRCFCNLKRFIVCRVTPVCLLQELQSYRKKCSTATPAAVTCGEIAPGLTKWSGGDRCHSGGFLLRIMPPSWQPVPACTRNGHSAGGTFSIRLQQSSRRDIQYCDKGLPQAELLFFEATKIRIGRDIVAATTCCRRAILPCDNDKAADGQFFPATKN